MIRTTFTTALFLSLAAATFAGPAVAESEPPTDAFGLPCEVTFAPKSATPPAKGAKAKKAKAARSQVPAPAPAATSGLGRGAEFALGRYDRGPSYKPDAESEMRMKAESLTPAMIGIVVRENAAAVELCMTKLPKDARVATVGLDLTIEPTGSVSAAKVTGAPKAAAFSACLAGAAKTWVFPHTDAAVEIEYPITLNGR